MSYRMPAQMKCDGQEQVVEDDHHLVFHHVGGVALEQFLVPLAAEVRHEPEHVAPPGAVLGRMRVAFVIAEGVMLAMLGDPHEGRAFAREAAEQGEQPANRAIGLKALVREQPVVAHAHAEAAGDERQDDAGDERGPAEEERRRRRASTWTTPIQMTIGQLKPNSRKAVRAAT